jgi:DNA-directed RNA polymerase specialized sigma24 family protein
MPPTPELLERAKKGRRAAIEAVITEYYPRVHRVAQALCGQELAGLHVERQVIRRSLAAMRTWDHPPDVQRWFLHHTILASRQRKNHEIDLVSDPLIRGVATNSAYYPAFIRAVRTLPMQQREAYILHHGERLDVRGLSIAMDCSQEAAANHLKEATAALSAYGGDFFPTFTANMTQTYDRLSPAEELVVPAVRSSMRGRMSMGKVLGWTVTAIKLGVIAGVIFLSWKIVPMLKW